MKVSEFKHYDCDPDIMTVSDLYAHCCRLMSEGLGNRLVLIPNEDYNLNASYRCLLNDIEIKDLSNMCVYLDTLTNREEEYIDKELFSD